MWRVLRLDDNGNTYVIGDVDGEFEARALAAAFEARGHKQMYFVEPLGTDRVDESPALSPEGSEPASGAPRSS